MTAPDLAKRNLAEVDRSASEASKIVFKPIDRSQVDRYRNPPADTAYALEYAFHLLGDIKDKTVLDLGCGDGENVIALSARGANVIGIDVSPDLIAIASKRLHHSDLTAQVSTGDAYATGLPDESVDIIFCIALIHHLDIAIVRDEMWRVLRRGGAIILSEPIRFSNSYSKLRSFLPSQEDISEYEHPLSQQEVEVMIKPFKVEGTRYFRLPFVPLISRVLPSQADAARKASNWALRHLPASKTYASAMVARLVKP